jgi:hypothetical protein
MDGDAFVSITVASATIPRVITALAPALRGKAAWSTTARHAPGSCPEAAPTNVPSVELAAASTPVIVSLAVVTAYAVGRPAHAIRSPRRQCPDLEGFLTDCRRALGARHERRKPSA